MGLAWIALSDVGSLLDETSLMKLHEFSIALCSLICAFNQYNTQDKINELMFLLIKKIT